MVDRLWPPLRLFHKKYICSYNLEQNCGGEYVLRPEFFMRLREQIQYTFWTRIAIPNPLLMLFLTPYTMKGVSDLSEQLVNKSSIEAPEAHSVNTDWGIRDYAQNEHTHIFWYF